MIHTVNVALDYTGIKFDTYKYLNVINGGILIKNTKQSENNANLIEIKFYIKY